ncbi:MAG: hypothetical protein AAB855_04605, partial [Patescibacteria group bacterium]
VKIKPWNPDAFQAAKRIMSELSAATGCEVALAGSLGYEIAGEEDIDITIYCSKSKQPIVQKQLEPLLGGGTRKGDALVAYEFVRDGFHGGAWLVDPEFSPSAKASKQLDEALRTNPELMKEYEQLKLSMNGKAYKEYQAAKYEFYNRVLGI